MGHNHNVSEVRPMRKVKVKNIDNENLDSKIGAKMELYRWQCSCGVL